MADGTKIEWTDATWNPITGCAVVSPGCTNCYAMRLAGTRLAHLPSRAGLTRDTKAGPVWNGQVRLNEQWLDQPLRWKRPRRIFVCAHGDLFAENVPDQWIDLVFAVMALAPQHTFQVLTKRAARMRDYVSGLPERRAMLACDSVLDWVEWPLLNVWLGVSCEDQTRADERIPDLLATPAAIRFISAEPLLGPIDFSHVGAGVHDDFSDCGGHPDPTYPIESVGWGRYDVLRGEYWGTTRTPDGVIHHGHEQLGFTFPRLDWIIVGGESGPGARPMHPAWARSIRDQCHAAGTPFFFKQWGEWGPECKPPVADAFRWPIISGEPDGGVWSYRVGKARAGRLLDGVEHNGFPEARP